MAQISQFLRETDGDLAHWCPACLELHVFNTKHPNIFTGARWIWDGNIVAPTFEPSMNVISRHPSKKKPSRICHYTLKHGVITFMGDCTHAFKGVKMTLPPLPTFARDECQL